MAVATLGCGSATDVNSHSVVGTYSLVAINGHTLPAQNSDGSTVTAGTMTINGDATYTYSWTALGRVLTDPGTWVGSGNDITFTPSSGLAFTGVFDGTTLTVQGTGGAILVLDEN